MKWHKLQDKKPICYKTCHWDGGISDSILILTSYHEYRICYCHEGILDGRYFYDWTDSNTYDLIDESDVLEWTEIKR